MSINLFFFLMIIHWLFFKQLSYMLTNIYLSHFKMQAKKYILVALQCFKEQQKLFPVY